MKLVQQTILFFQEGNSDKTYEVDLCEVGPNEYLVNFRYGRRNANLKEGTKTVFPVDLTEAQKVFDKLVESKTKKGYSETEPSGTPKPTAKPKQTKGKDLREPVILGYLDQATSGNYDSEGWPLSRVIWRAGELRIKEAEKHLVKLVFQEDELYNYSLIWSLGRCGGAAAEIHIKELIRNISDSPTKNLARFALAAIGSENTKQDLIEETTQLLPSTLQLAVKSGEVKTVSEVLNELLFELKSKNINFLTDLYLMSCINTEYKPVVIEAIAKLPMRPPYVKQVRTIFKCSEFNGDYETYGHVSKLIESSGAMYTASPWYDYTYVTGESINRKEEMRSKEPRIAFNNKTKGYLERRITRNLDRLAKVGSVDFTKMATGYLLAYNNSDNKGPSQTTTWEYGRDNWIQINTHYPAYSEYNTLCFLLYANSPRLEQISKGSKWRYREGVSNELTEPFSREEAFPQLWDKDAASLATILTRSKCDPVLSFALIAFQANSKKEEYYTTELICALLTKAHHSCQELGLSLAQVTIENSSDRDKIILAALSSTNENIRQHGIKWLNDYGNSLLTTATFVVELICHEAEEIHLWLDSNFNADESLGSEIAVLSLQKLRQLGEQDKLSNEDFDRVTTSLIKHLSAPLGRMAFNEILLFIGHSHVSLRAFGVQLLLNHQEDPDKIPESVFEQLITDQDSQVRGYGVELFGKLSIKTLIKKKDIIVSFVLSEHPEMRHAANPILGKICAEDKTFAVEVSQLLIALIQEKERHTGLNKDIYDLFEGPLAPTITTFTLEQIWSLHDSFPVEAKELAALALRKKALIPTLGVEEWVKLGCSEILDLRKACWESFETNVAKVKYESEHAVKLLDAPWADSKDFAVRYFDEKFTDKDWNPDILISICDSVVTESQDYGKKKITQCFNEQDGHQYLLKLSEHPNTGLQLFVSNYVERYASNNFTRLKELEYFFTSALSQINKGRTVKTRLFSFLEKEALKDPEIAEWILPLVTRISLTLAIGDKAACLQLLLKIQKAFPHLDSPITIEAPEVK